jgi:hypothetical protein
MLKFNEKIVTIELLTDLWGTVPMDKEVFKTYIESKKPSETEEDESASVDDIEKKGTTGFHKDEDGVFIYDYLVKGFLKNAANVLKGSKYLDIKAARSKVVNQVFVIPRKIYVAQEIDGIVERPLRAQTAQGPRVSLARSEFIKAGTRITFTLQWLSGDFKEKHLDMLLAYGKVQGLGQNRGGGYGRFTVVE